MNRVSLILSSLMFITIALFLAPGIFQMNRGKILETIALWLAIFLGMALMYKNFGPGSPHPLFSLPDAMTIPSHPPAPPTDTDRG